MSDPQPPTPEGDRRDDQVASLLAVEPLDELTRRRLVDTALRGGSRRPWARYAAAAAITLALVGGGAALLLGQSGDHETATRPPARQPGAALTPTGRGSLAAGAAAPPISLGNFGNLGDASNLARLRAAAANARAPSGLQRAAPALAGPLATARACAPPSGPITAVATGTVRGRAALVLVSGGRLTVVVLDPCQVRPLAR
jgi:hypothetical protein